MATDGISPDTGEPISGETAKRWIDNYKNANPEPDTKIACFYGVNRINEILAQPGCIGIRSYYAIDDSGVKQLVLVGVNPEGINIWDLTATLPNEGGLIMDKGGWCPPFCPDN
ncbi:MAG: hypothetical protein AB7O48_08560 [Cyclobacteriaceae bacterium]